jgi:hypothetical protein
VDLIDAPVQTRAMDGIRYGNHRLISAVFASLAAPTVLYATPQPYPYILSAGTVANSFITAGSYFCAAWIGQTSDAVQAADQSTE